MRTIAQVERALEAPLPGDPSEAAAVLLALAEEAIEAWTAARGEAPTHDQREGFRLLALHHQGAHGVPSFNACRETCREIAYHYNVLRSGVPAPEAQRLATMMVFLVRQLTLFVSGKLQVEGLGDFCCASKPLRQEASTIHDTQ